jgi:molecular chaperone GrpE
MTSNSSGEQNAQAKSEKQPSLEESKPGQNELLETPPFVSIPETELQQLQQEALEYKDKYLRLLAEMDNTRKRMQKERQELLQYATQGIIIDFLNPIDHMENALKFTEQMSDDLKNWALGFQMILSQFKEVLNNNGVTPFKSQGTPFDPHRHEAIEMVISRDYAPGTVVEENVRGYSMGDKIIRPARVKVAKSPETKAQTEPTKTEKI